MKSSLAAKFLFVQLLTLGRIPLIMIFLAVSLLARDRLGDFWFTVAFTAMILSAVTDLFDGYFARRWKVTSRLGAYADPMTDKVFYLTTFPILIYHASRSEPIYHAQLLVGLAIFFLVRDQWVSFLRMIGALYQVDGRANWSGKLRTLIAFPVICTIYYYLQAPKDWWLQINPWVVYGMEILVLAINVISIWTYTVFYWPWLRREAQPPTDPEAKS